MAVPLPNPEGATCHLIIDRPVYGSAVVAHLTPATHGCKVVLAVESGQRSKESWGAVLRDLRYAAPHAAQAEIERFYTCWAELDKDHVHPISRETYPLEVGVKRLAKQ